MRLLLSIAVVLAPLGFAAPVLAGANGCLDGTAPAGHLRPGGYCSQLAGVLSTGGGSGGSIAGSGGGSSCSPGPRTYCNTGNTVSLPGGGEARELSNSEGHIVYVVN